MMDNAHPRKLNIDDDQDILLLYNLPLMIKRAIQELHGIAAAVVYDGIVTNEEIELLAAWLLKNSCMHDEWPVSRLVCLLNSIRADGIINADEQKELCSFLSGISASPEVDRTLEGVFAKHPRIEFQGKRFLFTGVLQYGKRSKAVNAVSRMGGSCCDRYSPNVDYLIIGQLGQDSWKYSRYGAKVEACMNAVSKGKARTKIVREIDFVKAVIG